MTIVSNRDARSAVPAARYIPAMATGLVGLIVSVVAFLAVQTSQMRIAELGLVNITGEHQRILSSDLENASNILYTLRDLFESVERPILRDEYQAFARELRERVIGLRDTGWAPRVTAGERAAFERTIRESGFPDFEIWERTADGRRVRASEHAEYYPLLYPDPVEITPHILGYDLASDTSMADTFRRAGATGHSAASPPVDLFVGQGKGFLSYIPVYEKGVDASGEPRVVRGFINAVFAIGPMVENILAAKTQPSGLDIYFFDPARPVGDGLIYWHSSRTRAQPAPVPSEASLLAGPHWLGEVVVADRTWGAIFAPTDKLVASYASWAPIGTLAAGLTITAMIVSYLLIKLHGAVRLEVLTGNLKVANENLLALRAAFHQLDTGIVLLDQDLRAQFINEKVRREWTLTEQQVEAKPTFESFIRHGLDSELFAMSPTEAEFLMANLVACVRSGSAISEDIGLANGEVVRLRSVVSPNGGRMLSSSNVTDLVRLAEQLRILANIDEMTGAANRRHFVERAEAEWIRFTRYGQPLSLLALDLDLFKSINDQFGHDVGDEVIQAVVTTCAASVRGSDILGRMGARNSRS